MPNRLLTDKCLRCGSPLITDAEGNFNKFHCCTKCTDFIHRQMYEMHMKRKHRKDPPPKHKELKSAKPYHKWVYVKNMYKEAE